MTANAPGVVSESYDPAWASFLASSHGASGFDEAAFRGTGDFAYEQGRLSRNTQAVADRRAVATQNYVMQRDAFTPVEATWASKLYDRAVAYGDARTETDRLFHPIEYQLGTRYWMAHALEGVGNVAASLEGLRNKSDGGLFDQGTNPFTQQSRWGVENQDTRLLAGANLVTAGVSGLESVATGAVRSGVETTALGINGRELAGSADAWIASREVPATGTLRLPDLADESLVRVYGGEGWAADVGQGASSVARLEGTVPGEQDVVRTGPDIVSSDLLSEIAQLPPGARPNPATYLSSEYIDAHLAQYDKGASYLTPKGALDYWGRDLLGRADGQFVMPSSQVDDLLLKTSGDLAQIETELGIKPGDWQGREFVRIDIDNPRELALRIPSGNEMGANPQWIPAGKLPTGYSEAVINQVPRGAYSELGIYESLQKLRQQQP